MADPVDIDKAILTLKKGTQLLKYGRKGKPKFYPFRLSPDESTLIWVSSTKEKGVKLASVSRILSGQRTLVFQRFPLPEKDHLSFSLIYNNGRRSLDLVCKDKVEAEVWFTGLNSLVSSGQRGYQSVDNSRDAGFSYESCRESSLSSSNSVLTSSDSYEYNKISTSTNSSLTCQSPLEDYSYSNYSNSNSYSNVTSSDYIIMQSKTGNNNSISSSDIRISISSAPSTSSHGSGGPDDFSESFGDVYIWGQNPNPNPNPNPNNPNPNNDILTPKPLESNVMLDVSYVACGVRHAALVTRQSEVFTWGEESSSGRLGHGPGTDIIHPKLVEQLSALNVEIVDCGEFHTCAVTASGDLYTWGDGTHNAGLLGHGSDTGHWIPKRVSGPLDGLQVLTVSCGTWHTALITTNGQLFTFGDGTFGALGHGNRCSELSPREVESLKGLRTISVSCGVWHTAAVVEVIMTQSSASSGKLFTWGDGDKYRLGHGDKSARLKPTCVPALIEYNFHRVACGHSITIGLTTSGHLFTMGSSVYGQLGIPNSDGKIPRLVEDRLTGEPVAELACGAYHVAVLTTNGEVYTWGKGSNGRLGHGDTEDRKTPSLVEALKDRIVKKITCGANFTAAICQHKWVSGAEQSQCSACRQAFGFTRKRHNCYNCGLVHCHSCSSKKALRAALSPNPGKPYRVCDSCYAKLSKVTDSGPANGVLRRDRDARGVSKVGPTSSLDLIKSLDAKAAKQAKKSESYPSLLQLKDIPFIGGVDLQQTVWALGFNESRAVSSFPALKLGSVETVESLKEANELLNQEIQRLRAEVEGLRQRCESQELELQNYEMKQEESMKLLAEESSRSKSAKEVIKSLTAQLKEMAERLPSSAYELNPVRSTYPQNGNPTPDLTSQTGSNGMSSPIHPSRNPSENPNSPSELFATTQQTIARGQAMYSHARQDETERFQINLNTPNPNPNPSPNLNPNPNPNPNPNQVEAEWIEQYEPGVYLTLVALRDGTRELKRVRFSRRRFGEQHAETWWNENRDKVYEKYSVRGSDRTSSVTSF